MNEFITKQNTMYERRLTEKLNNKNMPLLCHSINSLETEKTYKRNYLMFFCINYLLEREQQ